MSTVNAIAGRLSLRPPQRRSLEVLHRICAIAPPKRGADLQAALAAIRSEFASVEAFEERDFPSLCFALATGVGKTRLMGAFIAYLHLEHGHDNFFVLAPGLTVYNKLIADFTPNTPKYVFAGIAEFSTEPPAVITGENYQGQARTLFDVLRRCKINIFNIAKINTEVRGGHAPRIRSLSEYLGESYFDYLAALPDLVLLMDESHRYRGSAGVKAINELKPVLGLELTATPHTEAGRTTVPFKNVIYRYPLAAAMADGFVKQPAVVTRKDFNAAGMADVELERMKLEDGLHLHEQTKVELQTYALETGKPYVKPFVLVIAKDTEHAADLVRRIEADDFFGGAYRGRVIKVDSSERGAEEREETVQRLLRVEDAAEPTEIVVHVNMLKEGWDVRNLYTIIPLRAANARTLIEQSIGRGLRLPYGALTGVPALDRLNIVAHDRFQEIVDEANRPDSIVKVQTIELDPAGRTERVVTVIAPSNVDLQLGITPTAPAEVVVAGAQTVQPAFATPEERQVAAIASDVISRLAAQPAIAPTIAALSTPEVRARAVEEVRRAYVRLELPLDEAAQQPDIEQVVARVTEIRTAGTIEIPRITVTPRGEVRSGFKAFQLDLSQFRPQPVSRELFAQYLQSGQTERILIKRGGQVEQRPEDYVVAGLVDFDDVAYDTQADLLYDLAGQVVQHLRGYLAPDEVEPVLQYHGREIARLVHAQMQAHFWEEAAGGYETVVSHGFMPIKGSTFTSRGNEDIRDFRVAPDDLGRIGQYVFGEFQRALLPACKFQSNAERILAIILDRETERWFRPARDQFGIWYGKHSDQQYQPDFVAETDTQRLILETKAANEMDSDDVKQKSAAAVTWCARANEYAARWGGKPWAYALIPHNVVLENMTIDALVRRYTVR